MMQRENGMRKEAVEMLLVFDIGNTEIKMGVFRDDDLVAYWRMITGSRKTSDEYGITMLTMLQQKNITPGDIDSIVVSSVVPHIMHSFLNAVRRYIGKEPFQVAPGIKTGTVSYTHLDVYKRQIHSSWQTEFRLLSGSIRGSGPESKMI